MFEKILSLFCVTFFGRGSCSAESRDGTVASFMLNTLRVDGSWFKWVVISTPVIKVKSDIFMGNRSNTPQVMTQIMPLNLVDFRKNIEAGDLVLLGTKKDLESDVSIPPQLLHSININIKEKYSVSQKSISLPVWDSAGIIVDMDLSTNSGKCILELQNGTFIVSEFISRVTEFKKKGFELALRCLRGPKNLEFRQVLMNLTGFLEGKSIEDLYSTPAYKEIKETVAAHLENVERDSILQSQMREAFYVSVEDPEDLSISRGKLHEMMTEFTGTNMDLDTEELADQLQMSEKIDFKEFYSKWVSGPGLAVLKEEVYEPAMISGQFIKHVYRVLGVVKEEDYTVSTPDDFASNYNNPQGLRSPFVSLVNGFYFSPQTPVKL